MSTALTLTGLTMTVPSGCGCCSSCCSFGDPPDTLCVTVSGADEDCGYLNGTFTLTRYAPCQWGVTLDEITGWFVGVQFSPGNRIMVSGGKVFTSPSCGFGTDFQDAAAVPTCLPVTLSGEWTRAVGITVVASGSVSVTVSAGPCGVEAEAAVSYGSRPRPARPLVCVSAVRVEERAGCGGFNCRHNCTSADPAVASYLGELRTVIPADECQDCPGFRPPAAGR